MLATLLIAALLAIYSERSLRQRRVVNQLLGKQGIAYYTVENGTPFARQFVASESDFWHHFRYSIKMVILQPIASDPADKQLPLVSQLPRLDYLYIWPGGVKNFDNQPLQRNADGGLTDEGIRVLATDLVHLQHFVTTSADCSQDGLAELDAAMETAELLTVLPHKDSKAEPLLRK